MSGTQDPQALIRKAEKLIQAPLSFWNRGKKLSGYDAKYDDKKEALELYKQAAISLKKQRQNAEAGRALERAAELELDVNRDTDAIRTFKEAADTYDTTDPTGKIRCLQRVINYWVDTKGQFTTAAVYQKNLGELYLNQLNDKDKAIEAYQLAADWYGGAQPQTARGMQLKVADLSVFAHQYPRAAENYEMAGKTSMAGASGAYNTIDNFFKAGLCALITNMESIDFHRRLSSWCQICPAFASAPEYRFLNDMFQAGEQGDPEAIQMHLDQWGKVHKIAEGDLMYELLLTIKETVKERPDDFS